MNSEVLRLFAKVFSANFGGVASFGCTSKQFTKVFSGKILFPPIHESFSCKSLPLHGTHGTINVPG